MKDNSGKVLVALLAGASAGVIAGLLMAPDTGEATRGSVKKWAGKLNKDLEKNLQAGLDEIKKMSSDAYSKVTGAGDTNAGGGSSNTGGGSANNSGSNNAGGGSSNKGGGSSAGGSSSGGSSAGGGSGAGNTGGGGNA
ncbi:YtxH domain-containing protein [Pontibacter liquoris]|uniref:YtxH domain-containing protein n=1 Tax=Pontibacter liquoris TaxID=2905677 RepID=UPI001FA6D3CC|nr:YtxH domain-containing protein [Pontibacter liquoris]